MKKIILSLGVCSTLLLFSNCTDKDSKVILEIPDAKFKSYLLENFDKNADGNLSLSEAKTVKQINCSGMEIEVLDGIEKFANLESLDCSNNQLEELELRYNKKLNKLVCTGNKEPLTIYIGMSSPIRNPNIQKPKDNEPPQTINMAIKPIDAGKVTYDEDKTTIMIHFED
jgi:Leucine-rich repeat (LRR) protein